MGHFLTPLTDIYTLDSKLPYGLVVLCFKSTIVSCLAMVVSKWCLAMVHGNGIVIKKKLNISFVHKSNN